MAAIPLPEKGQPLDVNYIYEMANQINNLTNTIAVRSSTSSRVNTQSETTSNLRIFASTIPISTTSATSGQTETFSFNYPELKFVPVATATVVNNSGSDAGKAASVILNVVTTSKSEGVVRFGSSGAVDLSVNVIVVGIPN
jgi:hypothetical protein